MNTQTLDLAFAMSEETKAPVMGGGRKCVGTLVKQISLESPTPICFSPHKIFSLLSCAGGWINCIYGCALTQRVQGCSSRNNNQVFFFQVQYQLCIQGKINNPPPSLFILKNTRRRTHRLFSLPCPCTAEALAVGLQVSKEDSTAEMGSQPQG